VSEGVSVEPLRLGRRRKRAATKRRGRETTKSITLRNQAREFRALGNILCINGKTFHDKLNGAIAVGLAEVCEMLAEVAEQEGTLPSLLKEAYFK